MYIGSEAGAYLRRVDSCITQRKAHGPETPSPAPLNAAGLWGNWGGGAGLAGMAGGQQQCSWLVRSARAHVS